MQTNKGQSAVADLLKLATYSNKLGDSLNNGIVLESWITDKITRAVDDLASVYHYVEYESKFNEFSQLLESTSLTESQQHALSSRLVEAKEKMKDLKLAQAKKMKAKKEEKMDESMMEPCGHCGGAGHVEKKIPEEVKTKVEKYNRLMKATKAAHKRMDANHNGIPDDEENIKEAKGAKPDFLDLDKDGNKKESMKKAAADKKKSSMKEGKMSAGQMSHHHACEYAKHHKAGNLELAMHHKEACEECGGMITHGTMGECMHTHPGMNMGQAYECYGSGSMMPTMEAKKSSKSTKADKDYDGDGKIESTKDEVWGSRAKAAAKAGHPFKEDADRKPAKEKEREVTLPSGAKIKSRTVQGWQSQKADKTSRDDSDIEDEPKKSTKKKMEEAKPSAGMSKGAKSALVKKAKAGGDIGKPGKSFDKVAKAAGGGEKGKKIAAAAMWKNAHESVELSPVAINESADLTRLKELTHRLLG